MFECWETHKDGSRDEHKIKEAETQEVPPPDSTRQASSRKTASGDSNA